VEKTHLLFSPVTRRFIYVEKIVGPVAPEALRKAKDHHAGIAYRDADGTWYSREEFEKRLLGPGARPARCDIGFGHQVRFQMKQFF